MSGSRYRTRSTTWVRHPLKRLLRKRRNLAALFAVGGAGAVVALSTLSAGAAPTSFLVLDGNIRNGTPTSSSSYDWGNRGSTYDNTACANGGINAGATVGTLGSGGIFNCGKQGTPSGSNTNPLPIAPSLTPAAAADPTIVASAFVVDPLFNSNNKNTGLTCPVTGASTTGGDPTAVTTGASKNDLPLNGFVYAPTSLQPKDDLANIYAVAHRTSSGVNEVFFGAERVINNGASHIDFEFLQSQLSLVPSGTTGSAACTGNFSGHRTGGDFLAAVDFANGGSFGSATIYEWSCGGTVATISGGTQCDPGSVGFPNAQYIVAPNASAFQIAFNGPLSKGVDNNIACGGWVCRGQMPADNINTVSTNEFVEGGVDLNALGFSGCVNTLFPHTRSSPDINATLQDFAGPVAFNTCSITTTPGAKVTDVRGGSISDTAFVSGFTGAPGVVDFKLYGPFASFSAITSTSCTAGKLAFDSGLVSASSPGPPAVYTTNTGSTPLLVGAYQWVASYQTTPTGAIEASGLCGDASEQVAIVDAKISISPNGTNPVGTPHIFTITVNAFPAGLSVSFTSITPSVTPAPGSQISTCGSPTLSNGGNTATCTVTINSAVAQTFTANATAVVQIGSASLTRTTDGLLGDSGPATKTYVDANINLSPASKTNAVGSAHTITATVLINAGTGGGFVPAANGTLVTFSLSNSNGATASFVGGINTCTTTAGTCSVSINSPTTGLVTINATTNVSVGGISVTRSTGDSNAGDGPAVTKTYVDAQLQISPLAKTNELGKDHVITATVKTDSGDGNGLVVTNGVLVTFSLTNSSGATAGFVGGNTCTTAGAGTCSVTINSPTSGQVAIHATISPTVGGIVLTRSTGDGLSGDSADANKTYVDAFINLVLQHTPDQVGDIENVTASVFVNDGSGAGYVAKPGALVNLSILSGSVGNFVPSGTTTSCTTGATGQCTVQITSLVKGTTTVHASTSVVVGGVTLNRATGDGISQDGQDVVKTWLPFTPTLSTTPSAGGNVGSVSLSDTANVTGAFGAAGSNNNVTFKLFGPFATQAAAQADCTGTPVFTDANKQLSGGTAGQAGQSWSASSGSFSPTTAGWYAWQVSADFAGDQANNNPTPNPSPCSSETVLVNPVNPSLATTASSPASIVVNTTVSISDSAQLGNFVNLQAGDTVTFNLYGPFGSGTPVCDTTNNTNRVLGPFTGAVNTTTGAASSGSQSFTPTAAGTYYWVATFSGDVNNTNLNATNIGCGDSHEAVVVTAPSAQITPTGITCSQFVGGTAPTLSNFTYAVSNGIIANDQPGVFFYYDRITLKTGANTITINEIVKSGQGDNYLLHILNDSTSQVNLFDNNCNVIGSATVTFNTANHTYTVTITVNISGTPAPFYVISAKYTPKTIVGQPAPSPSTLDYQFSTTVNGSLVAASTQDILGIKS